MPKQPAKQQLKIVAVVVLVLTALALWQGASSPVLDSNEASYRLMIKNLDVGVELAQTPTERSRGLSGRANLPLNEGLLFVFEEPSQPAFWMKDMNFAIDILWISADYRVVGVSANLAPESYPQTFSPPTPVKYVLEINAGQAAQFGVEAGDEVNLYSPEVPI